MAVPQKDADFNSFMSTSSTYLNAMTGGVVNHARLGLLPAEHTQWDAYAITQWPPIWAKIIDPSQKTKAVVDQKDLLKAAILLFMNPLLYRMASVPGVNTTDKNTMRLPNLTRSKTPRPAITTAPNTAMSPLEGAKIMVSNRVDNAETRDHMHPAADALQMVYKIGSPPPAGPETCTGNFMSSKAKFTFDGGMVNDGQKLYVFTRWVNIAEPAKSGPWCPMEMVTISGGTVS